MRLFLLLLLSLLAGALAGCPTSRGDDDVSDDDDSASDDDDMDDDDDDVVPWDDDDVPADDDALEPGGGCNCRTDGVSPAPLGLILLLGLAPILRRQG